MNRTEVGDFRQIGRRWVGEGVKVQMCVTSPPYFGLRDYGVVGQIGLEETPEKYVAEMVETFRIVRDLLVEDGTVWLNLGDSYSRSPKKDQHKPGDAGKQNYVIERANGRSSNTGISGLSDKNLLGIPWRVAFALQADGWILRQDIIWMKRNPLPESVKDRCTKSHEYIFLLSKAPRYYFNGDAIAVPCKPSTIARVSQPTLSTQAGSDRVPGKTNGPMKACFGGRLKSAETGKQTRLQGGREDDGGYLKRGANRRSVWDVTTKPFKGAHFATFPPDLIEPCILAGSRPGDIVLDPFMGSGTTAGVAVKHGRQYLGCELNAEYTKLHQERIRKIVNA